MPPTSNQFDWQGFLPNVHDTYPFIDPTKASAASNQPRGRSVLITGASKGIGLLTAARFATAGFSRIAIAARSSLDATVAAVQQAAAEAGHPEPQILSLTVDVSSAASLAAAADKVSAEFGERGLDVLINNAGYLEQWVTIGESEPTDWWRTWEVNVNGVYLACKFFLPLVLRSELKTIINLSSIGALGPQATSSAYTTTKFAVCRLTECLHNEYAAVEEEDKTEGEGSQGADGLVVIAVHPGAVVTELARGLPEYMHSVLVDEPMLSADAMLWLARERRPWLSGRMISCNWDFEHLVAKKGDIVEGDLLKFRMAL